MPYYLSKDYIFVENFGAVFVNIPDPVLINVNAPSLHDDDRLLACKAEIMSIV